jgi:tRNA (uracil-5-)-methyltransferase
MSITKVYPERYQQLLEEKTKTLIEKFSDFSMPELEVFESPPTHYRMRAEFKIWQQDSRAHYAMFEPSDRKTPVFIDRFPIGSKRINELMTPLLDKINACEVLRLKLFQVEFLTTLAGEALVTMIYHKALDEQWQDIAKALESELNCHIIGRSKKQKVVLSQDFVTEHLSIRDRVFSYQQVEASFTQPNAAICTKMLNWAMDCSDNSEGDLLELYCGNGNFTAPLATQFDKVVATEISKTSVKSAELNFAKNGIDNVKIARMSSEEFSQAMDKVRAFRRLRDIDLDDYNFSSIFVDPPRAGMDDHTTEVCKRFNNIMYISCNPDTLLENLRSINLTHEVLRFALFDQFPYTHHMECGVFLRKRD